MTMNYSSSDTRWRQRRRRPAHPTNHPFHHGYYCLFMMMMAVILLLQLFSPPNDFCWPTTTTPLLAVAAAAVDADGGANVDDDTTSSNANSNLDNTAADAQSSSSSQSTNNNNAGSSASATFNSASSSSSYAASGNNNSNPALTSNSVVLITGAAGFLGSELALALLRTYKVHKLLLVDNLGIDSENESSYVPPPPKDDKNNHGEDYSLVFGGGAIYEVMSEEDVSMFEIKRQRAFRVLHEMTSPMAPPADSEDEYYFGSGGEDGKRRRRTRPEESIRFYRADMRPSIPEFFDVGELPLLEGIFQSHPDITHVVHLADVPLHAQNQVIPRNKDSIKTGCMEGILEEFRLMIERANITNDSNNSNGNADGTTTNSNKVQLPHFVYASSHEVYDRISSAYASSKKTPQAQQQGVQGAGQQQQQQQQQQGQGQEMPPPQQPNPPPFQEDKPITTPSSLHGTAKLIDEILASAYHSTHGIYSVGLRFFQVYGPWDAPGTEVFDLAEQIWAMNDSNGNSGVGSGGADGSTTTGFDDSAFDEDINDYIYIDDAIDAILSAMQYRPHTTDNNPPPVVFNVGSGKGYTRKQVKEEMGKHFPKFQSGGKQFSTTAQQSKGAPPTNGQRLPTKSIASTARSESLLGFKAQVSLEEGLAQTLTWHRDRTYPYGRDPNFEESFEARSIESKIGKSLAMSRRRASVSSGGSDFDEEKGGNDIVQEDGEGECSPLDRECLRGTLVFPCASECRRVEWCTPSAWDDIAILSTRVTTGCDAVLYTVLLDESTEQIPSATAALAADSLPFVGAGLPEDIGERTQARCNIAFVSDKSPLVEMLKSEGEEYLDKEEIGSGSSLPPLLRHGFWTVLPVSTSSSSSWLHAFGGTFSLEYLPKISPGRFFGSSVRFAVYAAPTVLVNNLPNLLKRMEDGPVPPQSIRNRSVGGSDGSSTALLISSKRNTCDPAQRGSSCSTTYTRPPANDGIQSNAYNMIRMALRGEMLGGGLEPLIDSSVLVHSLREEESRLFRCDVYGEAAQWGASSDERSFEFVISVHDLWSRAVNHWSTGLRPWWVDAGGTTKEGAGEGANLGDAEKKETIQKQQRRRLLPAGGSKNMGELWMSILSSSEYQLFTLIMPSDSMGIVHLE